MTSTNIGCLSRNSIRLHRTRSATNPSSEIVIPTITFANRSSASDSVDPPFQDYLQDQGHTKVFLHFGSLKNSCPEDSGGSLELGLTLQVPKPFLLSSKSKINCPDKTDQ